MLRRPLIRRGCSWPFKVAVLFNLRSSLFFPSSDRSTREVRRINSRGINLRARNQASRRIETLGLFSFPLFFSPSPLPSRCRFVLFSPFVPPFRQTRRFQRFDDEDVWWFRYGCTRRGKYPATLFRSTPTSPLCVFHMAEPRLFATISRNCSPVFTLFLGDLVLFVGNWGSKRERRGFVNFNKIF